MPWLPFQQNKSVSLLLKNDCEVWWIRFSDLQLCDISTYFDENQQESVCCKKPYSYTNCNIIDC